METEYKTVSEVADQLSKELGLNVTESRVRRYEELGLLKVKRSEDSKYRLFNSKDISITKAIIVLAELGVRQNLIRAYINKPDDPKTYVAINSRIGIIERFIGGVKDLIAKFTFENGAFNGSKEKKS